eukprot:2445290-Amphidinium_carterae.1
MTTNLRGKHGSCWGRKQATSKSQAYKPYSCVCDGMIKTLNRESICNVHTGNDQPFQMNLSLLKPHT